MFIFYYAVLSEVTPPTALAAVAAAAITGGDVHEDDVADVEVHAARVPGAARVRAHRQRRRRCCCSGPLARRRCGWPLVSALGVAALAVVTGGWLFGRGAAGRSGLLCVPAALLLLYLQPLSIGVGVGFLVAGGCRARRQLRPRKRRWQGADRAITWIAVGRARASAWSPPGCGGKRTDTRRRRRRGAGCEAARRAGSRSPPATPAASTTSLGGGLAQLISDNTKLQGDRRRDRRVGAEHPAARRRRLRHRVLAGRHRGRRGAAARAAFDGKPQQVHGAGPDLLELHAGRWSAPTAGSTAIADMRGKRISTGSPKSGTEVIAEPAAAGGRPGPDVRRAGAAAGPAPRPWTA